MLKERTIDATWAEWICEVLDENNCSTRNILNDLGLRRLDFTKPDPRISFTKLSALLNRASIELDDRYLGLHLGSQIDFRRGGLLAYIMLNTSTLGQAIYNNIRYCRVHQDVIDIGIEKNENWWRVTSHFLDPEPRSDRSLIDIYIASRLTILRTLTGVNLVPRKVQIAYPIIDDVSEHQYFFSCPIEFGAEINAIELDLHTFDLPVVGADDRLLNILESYARDILEKLAAPEEDRVIQHAREIIANYLPTSISPTIELVSSELNMSVRTLSRRLSERGITFRELTDSLRRSLAERYLRDDSISLAQIAYLIGYSDQAVLIRSFKRWTDLTPTQFRKGLQR